MTFPSREDITPIREDKGSGYLTNNGMWGEWGTFEPDPKPRLDWLLLAALTADLGLWVGLLAWWIWR